MATEIEKQLLAAWRSWPRTLLAVLAALAVIWLVTLSLPGEGNAPARSIDAETVTVGQIEAAFAENEPAASQRFASEVLEVSGKVREVRASALTGSPMIAIEGADAELVGPDARQKAIALKAGQQVRVRCAGAAYSLRRVMLSDCSLI